MHSIRNKIIISFVAIIVSLIGLLVVVIIVNNNLVSRYQQINSNIVYEQALKDSIWSLIEDCYNNFKTGDFTSYEKDLIIIQNLEKTLDFKTTHNKDTYAAYTGVKNSLKAVVDSVAVAKKNWEENGGLPADPNFFQDAETKFGFVKQNITDLILVETQNIATVSKEIQSAQIILTFVMVGLSISVIIVSFVYSLYFAKKITDPLVSLSKTAKDIAGGNLNLSVDAKTLGLKDEIGSLANSFSLMLLSLKKELRELAGERNRAQAITSSIGEGLYVVDKNYTTVVVNTAAEEMLGISAEKIIGQNLSETVRIFKGANELHVEDRPVYKTLMTGKAFSLGLDDDVYLQTAAGKKIPVSLSTSPLNEGTEIFGAVVVFKDITPDKESKNIIEQKVVERTLQFQREKAKLSASIENMPLGFLMTDIAGNLLVINSLAKKTLGGKDGGETYEKLKEIVKPKLDLLDYIKTCTEQTKILNFTDINLTDGRFLKVVLAPIISEVDEKQKKCVGVVILIEDITEAKVLDRSKDEFFSIASHELRTPLTAIRGNTSLIKEIYMDKLKDPDLVDMIDDIHVSAIRLINIVNDFLNVSRLEMGKIGFKKAVFDLVPLGLEIINELKDQADQKKLVLKLVTPEIKTHNVFSDRDRTKEVLINLVGNAIKFTDKGEIAIDFEPINGSTKISVMDTGAGIPAENQKLLFRKFQQAGPSLLTRDTTRGTGLGLYISKMIIEGMGGKIWLESSTPKGSVFSFTLPTEDTLVVPPTPLVDSKGP